MLAGVFSPPPPPPPALHRPVHGERRGEKKKKKKKEKKPAEQQPGSSRAHTSPAVISDQTAWLESIWPQAKNGGKKKMVELVVLLPEDQQVRPLFYMSELPSPSHTTAAHFTSVPAALPLHQLQLLRLSPSLPCFCFFCASCT